MQTYNIEGHQSASKVCVHVWLTASVLAAMEGKSVREKVYKWLAEELLPQLLPERAAQLAPALADPGGVAVLGIRIEPRASEQYAALALLQAALALCPPSWLSDRCWASACAGSAVDTFRGFLHPCSAVAWWHCAYQHIKV